MNNKLTDEKIKTRINAIEERRSASRDFWDGDYEYPEDIELLALRELQERRKADGDGMSAGNYCYHYKAEGENGCYAGVANVSDQVVDWNSFQEFKITVGRLSGDKINSIPSLSFLGEVNKS